MPKFYVIWIEGLGPRSGEKIKSIENGVIEYTTLLTQAMRIRPAQKEHIKTYLKRCGIADWTLTDSSFYGTDYAPSGTLCNLFHHTTKERAETSKQHIQAMLF